MKKIEMHCKTKYSLDKESTIDIEALLWNVLENSERGIVFVDKDSIYSFPKIEKIYNDLCIKESSFKNIKIGYGVEISIIINDKEFECVLLIKKQKGLKVLYKIMSLYLNKYNKKFPFDKLLELKENLLMGLILNSKQNIDLSKFDYVEINNDIDISDIDKPVIYSNVPNSLFEGEIKAKEVLYFHQHINLVSECRLYKDTEDTLKEFSNKKIVITNSNMLFDNLDNIIINDGKFYITHVDNFFEFEKIVRDKFDVKYRNPSDKLINRLNEELNLIEKLDYTYFYNLLLIISNYCKEENEYYQIDGYINNSLVAYILGITDMETYNLPYELFFSEIPKIEFIVSPTFYHKKLFKFMMEKFGDELIKCSYWFKLSNKSIPRVVKNYEIMNKQEFTASQKDYIYDVLENIPLYRENLVHSFHIIPKDKDIFDFTPFEVCSEFDSDWMKEGYFDYHDLEDNLIKIRFILNEDVESISNLMNKTGERINLCNDKNVYNLFRNTEAFKCKFRILDRKTGLLNIRYFDIPEIENRLLNISRIWMNDLINILMSINHGIIKDDLYNELVESGLDEKDIFNCIDCLKQMKLLVSRAFMINKIRISYMQMYYKLYYPREYYKEMLSKISYQYIDEEVYSYSIDDIKKRYYDLNERNKLYLSLEEYEKFELFQILIEMYERGIKYLIINKQIMVG